ncbi:MAG: cation diffusion facilitator family transporter [Myxococcales bacterium]|jgi:cation diffusion facilitator family transporter|nr:cation diffusion facilitator family transporter [Myxococcales bacterium]
MYGLIKKRFISDWTQTQVPQVRFRYGIVAGVLGIASNLVLFGLKMAVGLLSGSISIVADAINNLSDAGSSVVTVLGFKLSSRPADAEHPFGHARYEYIGGFIVAFAVLLIGVLLAKSSIEKIIAPEPIDTSIWVFVILVFSIAAKLWQAALYANFGKAIDSSALKATAIDSRNDVITTSAVLLSVIVAALWPSVMLDGYMGLAVSIFIVVSGVRLIKESLDPLLGSVPDEAIVERITQKMLSYDGVLGIHDLVIHNYGPANCFATLHAEFSAHADFVESHNLVDDIERDFMRDLNIFLVIHMDPIVESDPETDALRRSVLELLRSEVCAEASIHDFRIVRGPSHTNVLFDVVLPFENPWDRKRIVALLEAKFGTESHALYFVVRIDKSFVGNKRHEH